MTNSAKTKPLRDSEKIHLYPPQSIESFAFELECRATGDPCETCMILSAEACASQRLWHIFHNTYVSIGLSHSDRSVKSLALVLGAVARQAEHRTHPQRPAEEEVSIQGGQWLPKATWTLVTELD